MQIFHSIFNGNWKDLMVVSKKLTKAKLNKLQIWTTALTEWNGGKFHEKLINIKYLLRRRHFLIRMRKIDRPKFQRNNSLTPIDFKGELLEEILIWQVDGDFSWKLYARFRYHIVSNETLPMIPFHCSVHSHFYGKRLFNLGDLLRFSKCEFNRHSVLKIVSELVSMLVTYRKREKIREFELIGIV